MVGFRGYFICDVETFSIYLPFPTSLPTSFPSSFFPYPLTLNSLVFPFVPSIIINALILVCSLFKASAGGFLCTTVG